MRSDVGLFMLCLLMATVSCRSAKTVTHDTYSLTNTTVHDTQVRFRDTYHTLIQRGDTVFQRDSVHDIVEINHTDTVFIERSDSTLHDLQRQIEYRDRPLSGWTKGIITAGYLSILSLIIYLLYRLIKFLKRFI